MWQRRWLALTRFLSGVRMSSVCARGFVFASISSANSATSAESLMTRTIVALCHHGESRIR
jgi:hypothetical protein